MNWINKLIDQVKSFFSLSNKSKLLLDSENCIESSLIIENELESLNEIIIGSNEEYITLNRIQNFKFDDNWSIVNTDETSNFLSLFTGASAITGSTNYATKGLYKATTSPNKLMVYNNGTTSSITLNGKKFSNHAGFVKAGKSVFTPVLAFQFASFITAQYYMNDINLQLKTIQKGIEQLLNFHKNERIAKIKTISNRLIGYEQNKFYTLEDFVTIENIKMELATIRYEYILAAQQQLENALFPKNSNSKIAIQKPNYENIGSIEVLKLKTEIKLMELKNGFNSLTNKTGLTSVISSVKSTFENSGNKVDKITDLISESQFFYFTKAALEAEKLYQYVHLIELKANLAYKNPDENRIGKISQIYKSIKNFTINNNSINNEVNQILSHLKNEITSLINKHKNSSVINNTRIIAREKELVMEFENIESITKNITELEMNRTLIINDFEKPIDFVFDNRDDKEVIYIKKS